MKQSPRNPVVQSPVPTDAGVSLQFFTREEWWTALATFLIAFGVFFYCMSPEVTLQDSGELVTGAFHFGVPHPPGYPLWTFLGWVWRHLIPLGNPAWRICLMSVLTGALVVGVMTLLMTRSILMLLRSVTWGDALDEKTKHWIALFVGASASLLFGFNRGVWLWACVPEMRVLNVFMFTLTACTFFAWTMRPQRVGFLYATILVYALGITNHQTIAVMALPFLIGAFAVSWETLWESPKTPRQLHTIMTTLGPFWAVLTAAFLAATVGFAFWAWLESPTSKEFFLNRFWYRALAAGLVAAVLLVFFGQQKWLNRRRALICAAVFLAGCSFYAYMPVASSTNPPMNWGYASTKQGFLHSLTRGQYEKLNIASPFSKEFLIQIRLFTGAMINQYSLPLCLVGLAGMVVPLVQWRKLRPRGRVWYVFVWAAFATTSAGLLTIINPQLDKINQEINLKFFAPAHGFFAILIGYGFALGLAAALARWPQSWPGLRVGCVLLLVLPVIPMVRNRATCDQRGHDFGYQFGYRMFYPGGDYPPMERDAVLYGGTDPGRFVPTYMIFCESFVAPWQRYRDPWCDPAGGPQFDRRDVYIITQNALADATYLSYIRDHYDHSRPNPASPATLEKFLPWQRAWMRLAWKPLLRDILYPREPIRIPTEQELSQAFQQYVNEARNRPLSSEEQVSVDAQGRVSVRGVGGVMAINGILTKWIFDWNKDKHAFYVEESYVIPWMYPHLTPHGIIMKINRDVLPTPQENPEMWAMIVKRDRAYWDALTEQFLSRPEFRRDADAQRAFAKLRSAIGGIYAYRRMLPEAEYAFQQARQLSPESPEANFRLAQLYVEQNRFDEAIAVIRALHALDPLNPKIAQAISQMEGMQKARSDIQRLESVWRANPNNFQTLAELSQAYARLGQHQQVVALCEAYISQTNRTVQELLGTAQILLSAGQLPQTLAAIQVALQRFPQDAQVWYAAALLYGSTGQADQALHALATAVQLSPGLREQARNDARFGPLQNHPRFRELVQVAPLLPMPRR